MTIYLELSTIIIVTLMMMLAGMLMGIALGRPRR